MMSKLDYFKVIVQNNKSLKTYNVADDGDLDLNIILDLVKAWISTYCLGDNNSMFSKLSTLNNFISFFLKKE